MTLCAVVHPPSAPTVLSDLIVTDRFGPYLTPSNLGNSRGCKLAQLARKSLFLEEGLGFFGFAGDGQRILDFAEYLPIRFAHRPADRTPMRFIGDAVNDFNAEVDSLYGGPKSISIVGFSPGIFDGQEAINVLQGLEGNVCSTTNFNDCYATGSGSNTFFQLLRRVDGQLHPKNSSFDNLIYLLGTVNGEKLFNENSKGPMENTWGGYVEATSLENYQDRVIQSGWLHVAYVLNEPARLQHFGRQVYYWRDKGDGHVGVRLFDGRQSKIVSFPIRELFNLPSEDTDPVDWSTFSPEFVTVTILPPLGRNVGHLVRPYIDTEWKRHENYGFVLSHPEAWFNSQGADIGKLMKG